MTKNSNPYEITNVEWDDLKHEHYDKVSVFYDSEKDTLTEEPCGIVYDEEERSAIGEQNISSLIDKDDGIILVRNDHLGIDYEVTRR